ncbi:hypothetical protein [Staphylococcus felis]|uniref:hypothetical protein n=1 Tax=Staphylococcus felis TaxID=46127 RepID=UPI001E413EBC|nr:hypothetical protein [Staphylococcus felis]
MIKVYDTLAPDKSRYFYAKNRAINWKKDDPISEEHLNIGKGVLLLEYGSIILYVLINEANIP